MTIRQTAPVTEVTFTASNVLCPTTQVVHALARNAMESILDTTLEMCAEDSTQSRVSIEADIDAMLRERTLEFVNSAVNDYKKSLIDAVNSAEFTVKVRGIDYSCTGLIEDIKVDFSFANPKG
jgi:hypothetical protein